MSTDTFAYIYYGAHCHADELQEFLRHTLSVNATLEKLGKRQTPVCIWGRHGIGKTEIVEAMAASLGQAFRYIAPAQFEEMGDLLGMPYIDEPGGSTHFAAPEWVPKEEGPGIFLIDDVNRADDRILRGIMQLLQNFELASWSLPPKWQIVLTANPDGGDYSVTPMDDAMLTRMLHVTLDFDVKRWARWAESQGVDARGISFVLTYPETVSGQRTTPRSLVQFFERIAPIADLKAELQLVSMLAESCLEKGTVAAFLSFISHDLAKLISPEEILRAKEFGRIEKKIDGLVGQEVKRVDILSTICTRLVNFLVREGSTLTPSELRNLKAFVSLGVMPEDMRLAFAQDLMAINQAKVKTIFSDPTIGRLLLQR
jgi:hypothetical protein